MCHLTAAQRGKIEILSQQDYTNKAIAKEIGCHPSTIGRELKRCSVPNGSTVDFHYSSERPEQDYRLNRLNCRNRRKLNKHPELARFVLDHLKSGHDPDQIAGRLAALNIEPRVCRETIYAWIYDDPICKKEQFYQYLKYGKKKRGYHRTHERTRQQFKIPNRVSIHQRPQEVDARCRFGDWEGDTVLYPDKYVVATLYERLSGIVRFRIVSTKSSQLVCQSIGELLNKTKAPLTLTLDNGVEFFRHKIITELSGSKIYFADKYSSHQRGGNEQMNRQLRRYLPRGKSINDVTDMDVQDIEDELNNKPRKRLAYRTPNEVYNYIKENYNKVQQEGLDVTKVAFEVGV